MSEVQSARSSSWTTFRDSVPVPNRLDSEDVHISLDTELLAPSAHSYPLQDEWLRLEDCGAAGENISTGAGARILAHQEETPHTNEEGTCRDDGIPVGNEGDDDEWVEVTEEDILTSTEYRSVLRRLQQEWDEASHLQRMELNRAYSAATREMIQRELEEQRQRDAEARQQQQQRQQEGQARHDQGFLEELFCYLWSLLNHRSDSAGEPRQGNDDIHYSVESVSESSRMTRVCDCLGGPAGFHRRGCPLGCRHECNCLGASAGYHHPDCH